MPHITDIPDEVLVSAIDRFAEPEDVRSMGVALKIPTTRASKPVRMSWLLRRPELMDWWYDKGAPLDDIRARDVWRDMKRSGSVADRGQESWWRARGIAWVEADEDGLAKTLEDAIGRCMVRDHTTRCLLRGYRVACHGNSADDGWSLAVEWFPDVQVLWFPFLSMDRAVFVEPSDTAREIARTIAREHREHFRDEISGRIYRWTGTHDVSLEKSQSDQIRVFFEVTASALNRIEACLSPVSFSAAPIEATS